MNHSTLISQKPLVPALFQIAARADDLQSMPILKDALMSGGISMADRMLDAERLEAILKTLAQKKKQTARRELPGHFEKRISEDANRIA